MMAKCCFYRLGWKCYRHLIVDRKLMIVIGVIYSLSIIRYVPTDQSGHESEIGIKDLHSKPQQIAPQVQLRLEKPIDNTEVKKTTSHTKLMVARPVRIDKFAISNDELQQRAEEEEKRRNDALAQEARRRIFSGKKRPDDLANISAQGACHKYTNMRYLTKGELPLTALASFPGSGNTWFRTLIAGVTGIITGDIYRDRSFALTPGFSYRKDDTVVVVKTHHPFWDDNNGPDPNAPKGHYWQRAVLLVRHPLDATISVFNWHKMKGSHIKTASISMFLQPSGKLTAEWECWAHNQIRNWGRWMRYWINQFEGQKFIVFYENLKEHLEEDLISLSEWLGVKPEPGRLACTLQSSLQAKFKRDNSIDKRILYDSRMLEETEAVLQDTLKMIETNYTHFKPLHIPDSYSVSKVRENFSVLPAG